MKEERLWPSRRQNPHWIGIPVGATMRRAERTARMLVQMLGLVRVKHANITRRFTVSEILRNAGVEPNGYCHCGCAEEPNRGKHFVLYHDIRFLKALAENEASRETFNQAVQDYSASLREPGA